VAEYRHNKILFFSSYAGVSGGGESRRRKPFKNDDLEA